MSWIKNFEVMVNQSKLSRRRALLGLSLLTLAACSRTEKSKPAPDNNVEYYTCTMHPFVRSQDPNGKCPVCGMSLVPVMKSGQGGSTMGAVTNAAPAAAASIAMAEPSDRLVEIAPERMQQIGVTTEVATRRNLTRTLRAPARVAIDESALRDINVKSGAGFIEKLYANYEGKRIKKGEPLMRVLSEGWLAAQTDFIRAYRDWKRTPLMSPNNSFALSNKLELMRARIRVWDLSNEQIDSLQKFALSTNEVDLRTGHGLSGSFDLLAPFDGYVHKKTAIEGMRFEVGQSLLEVADDSRVWVVGEFPEDQGQYVDLGQKMTVTFPSMPQMKMSAPVEFLDPHVDETQRRVRVRLVLPNGEHRLHSGLFAEVTGEAPLGERLTVSTSAVVPTGNKYIVFIDRGQGKLEPRQIEIGARSGDYYEVISGLNEGDRVVSSANFLIDAESRIQGVLKTWGGGS